MKPIQENKKKMFVREKKVKGNSYFYLVKSERIQGVPRQKVVKYLGVEHPSEDELRALIRDFSD